MSDFDLDLQSVEDQLPDDESRRDRIVLGILDGSTPDEEWIAEVEGGGVLVLSVEGDVNELASGFAREISELGGELMSFRDFLIVAPPDIDIDTDRL